MNTTELVERVAASHELTKTEARAVIETVFSAITDAAVKGDEVALHGFGRFKIADRAARQGRNPATGEAIVIAASRKLAFTAAKSVRDQLNTAKPVARKTAPRGKRPARSTAAE